MAIQDNYYEVRLNNGDIIFSPKANTQIEPTLITIKKGIIREKIGDIFVNGVVGEPPFISLTFPFSQIAFIKEYIGNYEEASKTI